MNILTRIFVVLVAILSVVLVALIVPFVANTENYREQVAQAQAQNKVLTASNANKDAMLAQAAASQSKAEKDYNVQISQLKDQLSGLEQRAADASTNLLSERANSAKLAGDLTRLADAEKQHAEITQALETELAERRDELLKERKSRIELAATSDRLQSDLDAAKRQLSRFQEQIAVMEETNSKLETVLSQVPPEVRAKIGNAGGDTAPYEPSVPIKGQVTKVQKVDDTTFVEINVGSADGVASNMRFLISRGGAYVGTMVITNVDTKSAAGRLSLGQQPIVKGDSVLTGGY